MRLQLGGAGGAGEAGEAGEADGAIGEADMRVKLRLRFVRKNIAKN